MEKDNKVRCSRCNEYMNMTDNICPNCGFDYGDDSPILSKPKDEITESDSFNAVQIVSIAYAILGLLGIIVITSRLESYGIDTTLIVLSGIMIIAFSSICLFGFGTIIKNTTAMKSTLNDIKNRLQTKK